MDPSIFRAYSIRGVAGQDLTARDANLIGRAAGTILRGAGVRLAVLGHDCRISSPELASSLVHGLVSTGIDLVDVGLCTTPMLNYATDAYRAGAGFMVTASHNPPMHNGIKIRTDHTWEGDEITQIYHVAQKGDFARGSGMCTHTSPCEAYLAAIAARARVRRPPRLVVDGGNGTGGTLAVDLLRRIGCEAIPLHIEPDGRFPNRSPDPSVPGALDALAACVLASGADAGLAYDGDGDRLAMVDEEGQVVYADRLLALLARQVLVERPGACIVHEISCTQAVADTVAAMGGVAVPCRVGYAFVHRAMRETGAVLGGETAGHLFFADHAFRFDDALLATARVVSLLSQRSATLSGLLDELPSYVQSPQYRLPCPDDLKSRAIKAVHAHLHGQGHRCETLDGVKAYLDGGWGLCRASNTQPVLTVRCEAASAGRLCEIEGMILSVARRVLRGLGIHQAT